MIYLLDTNTCIEYLRHGNASPVSAKLAAVLDSDVVICTVVYTELRFGALRSSDPGKNLADVRNFVMKHSSLDFDEASAEFSRVAGLPLEDWQTPTP